MSHDFVDQIMEKSRLGELRSPVAETLDMQLVEFARGEAVYEMPAREELANPLEVIQGGVVTVLTDAAMAAAATTILGDEEIQKSAMTTIDIFAPALGQDPRPAHRQGTWPGGRDGPYLYQRARGRDRNRTLTPQARNTCPA